MQISKIPGAGTYPGNAPEACSNTLYSRFFKRLLDILMAFIGLVLFMQVFSIIAIAIKLDTAGPVLFVQPRLGKRGEMFRS